ncbi:choice-of-anchor Q domain-containing protein [Salinimicrobium sp. TH3]|uniref:choice-of-anchor Q domain-containing protein n=1 Tax=Salinimicrobium sp. TH3 TaxID=2997342 RepID=UPI0022728769|nr:choice-of-anchor Q domain-containing protein [Salinimicrobium sp. TH3]MCY2687702.1 hypothetical protein [Salinimicrobium sp. TH3]
MKKLTGFIIFLMLVLWSSCRSDFESTETTGNLDFSRDTVFLDTVFSNLSTATYSLKVYNRSGDDIYIPEISLENRTDSYYRLNVDGLPGTNFENVEILARDSIYIFIETTVPSKSLEETEFLYTDKLQFKSRLHLQEVPLVTLVKDAILLYPKKDEGGIPEKIPIDTNRDGEPEFISGFYLEEEHLQLTRTKPYVIYGYAVVPEGKILSINAGARIHFHADSGILVSENASIRVKGEPSTDPNIMENQVIFKGDRLQSLYRNIPGQWGAIWLQKGSKNHLFEHVTFRNASLGILAEETLDSPPIQLKNVEIYNSAVSGIRTEGADILAENLVINNSGQASLYLNGGNHHFKHVSIVNYWSQSFTVAPAVFISNISKEGTVPLEVKFYNSIIFGNENRELGFEIDENGPAEIFFSHSLIKFSQEEVSGEWYDFSNSEIYNNIWLDEDPFFSAPKENDLRLLENSAAIDKGDPNVAQLVPQDILGNDRTQNPDLGAYEFVEIQE